MVYRRPLPLAPEGFLEGVVVDDHLGLQQAPRASWRHWARTEPGRDREVFEASGSAYRDVGLSENEKKGVVRQVVFDAWGATVEGDEGLSGPPRHKLFRLAELTAAMVRLQITAAFVMDSVLGMWVFAMSFRRPMFALFQQVYTYSSGSTDASEPFRLTLQMQQELLLAAPLAEKSTQFNDKLIFLPSKFF